jgi:hypothetical protein
VAYLVCAEFGLDSMDYTLGYVANWSNGDSERVLATAVTVQRCARAILEAAEQTTFHSAGHQHPASWPGVR